MADKPSQALLNAQKELEKRRRLDRVAYQPPQQTSSVPVLSGWPIQPIAIPSSAEIESCISSSIISTEPGLASRVTRVSPSLAAWCLDKNHRYREHPLDGPYRLFKILQALDKEGRGWLGNLFVEKRLTQKGSPYYIYGRRQLKNMLRRGEGLFWQRAKSGRELRIRLVARTKVVRKLLNHRLRGQEVSFPLQLLLGNGRGRQAAVNASLYAAIHAGQIQRRGKAGPVSRARLRDVSGCSSYRQRQYESRAGIIVHSHIHILGRYSEYELQRSKLHHRLPAYVHTDYQGKINRHQRGADYIARRLPNSYQTPGSFAVIHSRRQRTINRQLGGLCRMGSEGSDSSEKVRLFHENAAEAVCAFNRNPDRTVYSPLASSKAAHLWRSID